MSSVAAGLAFAFAGLVLAPAGAAFADEFTLEQCVDVVIHRSSSVLNQTSQYELSGAQLLQSYGQFLPDLNLGGTYELQKGKALSVIQGANLIDSTSRQATFNVTSTLNLFNGFSDVSGLKASLAREDAQRFTLEWAKVRVALDITQTFLQYVLDQQLLEIARNNLEASQSRLKLIEGKAEVGAASKPDLFRQQAETSADAFDVTNYETRANNDRLLLVRKLRIDAATEHVFKTPPLEPAKSAVANQPLEKLLADATGSRQDLLASQAAFEASDWDETRAKSGYLPRLDLLLARNAAGTVLSRDVVNGNDILTFSQTPLFTQLGQQVEYSATLNLTWNIFDRFTTTLNVRQARAAREVAEVARDDSRLQMQYDIRTAFANYNSAMSQLDSARTGLKAANKSYQAANGMYGVGSASIVDVLTAQAALVQARSNEAQALINLKLQDKALQYSVGKL